MARKLGAAAGSDVRFAVLGPVRAWRGAAELDLGPRQVRLMLALLLVRAGQSVATADFQTLLWGPAPPPGAMNIIYRHVGSLRRLLEPGVAPRASGHWLVRQSGDYRLVVDAGSLDLLRFRELAETAGRIAGAGDQEAALTTYLQALRIWTGPCAAGLQPDPELLPEFTRLDHERSAVACAAADVALSIGRATELLPAIRPIVELHPFNEALQARLLLALAADGKQAEAVATYEKVRLGLSDELGVRPGAEIRTAYERVLRQQGAAAGQSSPPSVAAHRATVNQLPMSTRFFSGRDRELRRMRELLPDADGEPGTPVVMAVDGLPGVGKTSLVVHWAHLVAGDFPDGHLFIDLRGYDAGEAVGAEQALTSFVTALAGPRTEAPATVEAQTALYRTLLTGRRVLVILDNARDAEQVRPLLPTAPGCVAVVTSRHPLTGLVVREGAYRLALEPPSTEESRAVLRTRLGKGRAADDLPALDEIIEGCGRLPLALAVVAARASAFPDRGLTEISAELRDAKTLDVFEDDDPRSDVRSVFSWSYRKLSEPAKSLFRLLALHPGPSFSPASAAGLAGIPVAGATALIAELSRARLLTRQQPQRYAFHDLIRLYAVELSGTTDPPAERHAALTRLMDHLQQTAYEAGSRLMPQIQYRPPAPRDGVTPERVPDVPEAMEWFAAEQAVLEAAVAKDPVAGVPAWQLVEGLLPFYMRLGMFRRLENTARTALRGASNHTDREGMARMHRLIGGAYASAGDGKPAVEHFERALELFDDLGMLREAAYVNCNLGWAFYLLEATDDSLLRYRRSLDYFTAEVDRPGEANALLGVGYNLVRVGEGDAALECARRAWLIFDEHGDARSSGDCAMVTGQALATLGRFEEAVESRHQARRLFQQAQADWETAENETALGDLYGQAGRRGEAIRCWEEARRIYRALGSAEREQALSQRLA